MKAKELFAKILAPKGVQLVAMDITVLPVDEDVDADDCVNEFKSLDKTSRLLLKTRMSKLIRSNDNSPAPRVRQRVDVLKKIKTYITIL